MVFLLACALVLFLAWNRAARIGKITQFASQPAEVRLDAASPTGYADGWRWRIVADDLGGSLEWITQTQTMLARGEARIRHVDSDNAPEGRETRRSSPYRWWLGLVAKLGGWVGRQPPGRAVEWAAVWAGPLLQLGVMAIGAIVSWRAFGWLAGAGFAAAWAAYYPMAALFSAGLPDARGAATAGAAISVLLLGAGIRAAWQGPSSPVRWPALAGLAGGFALWLDAGAAVPPLAGLLLAALPAAALLRAESPPIPNGFSLGRQLRAWSDAGGMTVLAGCAIEYLPHHLSSARLDSVHPLYGIAWIGAGRLAAAGCDRLQAGAAVPRRAWGWLLLETAAALSLPATLLATRDSGILARNPG
ncbi:MAG TPA: hypothetical protein VHV47_07130, partial [Opitutaceae bacterium]|nr:hypothetical protein [Opitutaceae bacterium]